MDIIVYIHLILHQLNDRKDEIGISQPAEHIIKDTEIFVLYTFCNTMREGSQYHTVDVWELCLYSSCHIKSIIISITRHTDNKVNVYGIEHLRGLFDSRHLCKGWRITQT